MKQSKRLFALLLTLTMTLGMLTACGGGASSSAAGSTSGSAPASAAPSGEKTVVTVWHMYAEDEEVTKPHQRLLQWAENYNATNTDNIEVVVSGAKTADVIMTTIASGSTPDIFQNYWNNAPTWANNGALYDLTEFVNGGDAEWNKDDFIDAAWDVCTYEDKVYSIPFTYSSTFLFYNKDMLAEAGYRLRTNPRQLVVQDPDNGIELFYLRPLDIAVYVGRGAIDVGITGQDLLKNSGTAALEHMPLGFGTSTFRFAAPNESPITTLEDIQGKRVATTFDKLVHDYLVEHGIQAETIHLDGAVESSVQLGVADLIADVVSTGTTLRNAGLRVFAEPLMHSEACLIRSPRLNEQDSRLAVLTRRLQGVLTAHQYVLMDYDIPISKVAAAVAVTPGFESPTISPLHDKQWNAVRVMVPKAKVNQLMDDLYEVGARGIIVTALQASRM